jgi:hypothetical protein
VDCGDVVEVSIHTEEVFVCAVNFENDVDDYLVGYQKIKNYYLLMWL